MSVIHYTPSELAAVASLAAGNTASDEGKRRLSRYLDALAAYSAANTACYVATYREQAPSWTAEDIRREVRAALMPDLIRLALSTLDGMQYNLVANDGTDFATTETLRCVLDLTQAIARRTRAPAYIL